MKRWSLPLSIKIFLIMVIIVSAALGTISWRNNSFIFSLLTRSFQTMSLSMGEQLGNEIEKFAIRMDNELFRVLQKTLIQRGKNLNPINKSFLDNQKDLDGFLLLRNMNGKLDNIGGRFRNPKTSDGIKNFDWLENRIKKSPNKKSHFAFIEHDESKLVVLARRFMVQKTSTTFWGLTYFSPSLLQSLFGSSDRAEVALVNTDLELLASNFKNEDDWAVFKEKQTVKRSISLGIQSAYLGQIPDNLGKEWLSSYYQIREYGLVVFVKQPKSVVYGRIYRLIEETALWSILLLLIVILISYLSSRKVTKQLLDVIDATKQISNGKFDLKIPRRSGDEVGQLVDSVNWMSGKIGELLESEKEKVRFQEELETAQIVQNAFYVDKDYQDKQIQISGYHKASSECCGDWWTHIKINDHTEQILIGDATGHGAPAALVTGMVYSIVHSLMEYSKDGNKHHAPKDILNHINQVMVKSLQGSMFMTFLAMEVDYKAKVLRYANAGHCFPFLLPADPKKDKRLDMASRKRGIKPIFQAGEVNTVLGAKADTEYFQGEIPLQDGDRIFSYTDGAFEFNMEDGKQFGVNNLRKLLVRHRPQSLKEFRDAVSEELEGERSKGFYDDDMTFVAFDYGPAEA